MRGQYICGFILMITGLANLCLSCRSREGFHPGKSLPMNFTA
jgi:hypothetical protein